MLMEISKNGEAEQRPNIKFQISLLAITGILALRRALSPTRLWLAISS